MWYHSVGGCFICGPLDGVFWFSLVTLAGMAMVFVTLGVRSVAELGYALEKPLQIDAIESENETRAETLML